MRGIGREYQQVRDAVSRNLWPIILFTLAACTAPEHLQSATTLLVRDVGAPNGMNLNGAILHDVVVIYTDSISDEATARFYFDDVERLGAGLSSEGIEPAQLRIDTRGMENGRHILSAVLQEGSIKMTRTVDLAATFHVENAKTITNNPPVVNAGDDATVAEGTPLAISGSASDDGIPSETLGFRWTTVSGPGIPQIDDPNERATFVTFPEPGTYLLRLIVTDGDLSTNDDITVTVTPHAPTGTPSPEYAHLQQIYISPGGNDGGLGTEESPLLTINAGLDRAISNRAAGLSTRLLLMPGVYRQYVDRVREPLSGPLIVIESYIPHAAILSGSDVYTDWSCQGGKCTHPWPYRWGPAPNPWPEWMSIGELALRREMVVVNGRNLVQVIDKSRLTPGSFVVDEASSKLEVMPPDGVDLSESMVEVAIRPTLLRLQGLNNLVVKGVVFTQAASEFRGAAVEIVDQANVVLDNCIVTLNGQTGVSLLGDWLTLRNTSMNQNGSSGITGFRVRDSAIVDSEASENNWRGLLGDYIGWEVGQKFSLSHRLDFINFTANRNNSRGLWLDTDIVDVNIRGATICGNLSNGIFTEAVQGPLKIMSSEFCENAASGLQTSATNDLTLVGNVFRGNNLTQVNISGDFDVGVTNWETGTRYTLNNSDWTWGDNVLEGFAGQLLVSTTMPRNKWNLLTTSSQLDRNAYRAGTILAFRTPGGLLMDFAGWQATTNQDGLSTFETVAAEVH